MTATDAAAGVTGPGVNDEITLEAFNGAELTVDGNYRRNADATITPGWVAQLKEHAKTSRLWPSATF